MYIWVLVPSILFKLSAFQKGKKLIKVIDKKKLTSKPATPPFSSKFRGISCGPLDLTSNLIWYLVFIGYNLILHLNL